MKNKCLAFLICLFMVLSIQTPFSVYASNKIISKKNILVNSNNINKDKSLGVYNRFYYSMPEDFDSIDQRLQIDGYQGEIPEELEIPSTINGLTVKSINDYAFKGSEKLKKVVLPETIIGIGEGAFENCRKLTDIKLPLSLTIIHSSFLGCTSLKSVTLPEKIEYIDGAFENCTNLTDINLPDSISNMSYAFKNCISLKKVIIPKNVREMSGAFDSCYNLTDVKFPKNMKSVNLSKTFNDCSKLKSVELPEGVEALNETFKFCESLIQISIPKSVNDIRGAFINCKSIKKISIPPSVSYTGSAFVGCEKLSSVKFEGNIKFIDYNCFMNTPSLKKIDIPQSVTSVEYKSFYNSGLTSVTIPPDVKSLGDGAFRYCNNLKSVNIKNKAVKKGKKTVLTGLKTIPSYAFANCSSLTKISLPKSIKNIKSKAFMGCKNLKIAVIPKNVTSISKNTFSNCGKFIIHGSKGSYAQTFAKKYKIPFVSVKVSKVKLNKSSLKLAVGSGYTLRVSVSPSNASYKSMKFTTSNKRIAVVSSKGKITAKYPGRAYIYSKAKDGSGKYARVTVTVVPKKVSKLKLTSGKKKATISISKTSGAKKYDIYRSTKKNKGFKKIKTTSSRKYVNKKLKSRKTYYYKVKAINGKYKGSFSKVYKVKVK
ncbi:leucine-rich repeat protein [uncultured Anaerofustis sp.]|uniref:leucine-rich repeat protein n=1 Tax=uncultured Anaerofustis sp. TaxID=904996 RepID=UPI0025F4609D|nr:leucine-rich repeat protein [uncultured Anaerofustis sp.]